MTRVPKTRSRLKKRPNEEAVFEAAPGSRLLAGGMCLILSVMLIVHQTQIVSGLGMHLLAGVGTVFFGMLAWYFLRRGARRGPVMRIGPDGFGMALGYSTWVEFPWDEVKAFRYWEPTGMALLVKRRQSRWVGVLLNRPFRRGELPWDARLEVFLNGFHNRPGLCLLHPFVRGNLLDVLQAFKDHAPKALDDYKWMSK